MKYIATITFGYQNSPESTAFEPRHLELTPETTVAQIVEWQQRFNENTPSERFPMSPVTIMAVAELEVK